VFDQCSDSRRAHGTVAQQILVMPHTSADQMAMIFKALLPAAGVLGAYGTDVDDEVDEFGLYRHGLPRLVMELKTSELTSRVDLRYTDRQAQRLSQQIFIKIFCELI
jgi:hypothetical protein